MVPRRREQVLVERPLRVFDTSLSGAGQARCPQAPGILLRLVVDGDGLAVQTGEGCLIASLVGRTVGPSVRSGLRTLGRGIAGSALLLAAACGAGRTSSEAGISSASATMPITSIAVRQS